MLISDYMAQNKTSPVIFTGVILAELPKGAIEVKIWSNGPASQFKNKYVIAAKKACDVKLVWNFFVTSHGKGQVDSVGGTQQRIAADKVQS